MAEHLIQEMQICEDWERGEEFSPEEFHALAPSRKPWSFTEELQQIWDMGYDGSMSTICVVDDGCQLDHENFEDDEGRSRIQYSESFVRGERVDTGAVHGTHTAGTAGGRFTGVAPKAKLEIYKGLNRNGSGSSFDLTACGNRINERKRSGKITSPIVTSNSSYGGGFYQPQEDQLENAEILGIVSNASAGNSGGREGRPTCGHPGTSNFVNCSAAIGRNGLITDFSSRCRQVDIASPGAGIISSVPGGRYQDMSGTSMSCPWLTGLICLLSEWQLMNGMPVYTKSAQWATFWRANAIDLGKKGHDWEYGHGVLSFKDVLNLMIRKELVWV